MEKRILVVDKSQNTTELLKFILNDYTKYNVDVEYNYDEIVEGYTKDKYEFIIIDHSCEIADELMNHILTNNPAQKCILLSDSINCPVSCDVCLSSFKFVRLVKPLNPKDILFYIDEKNEFICPNRYVFDSIDTLEKLYQFLNLENNMFYRTKELNDDKIIIKSVNATNIKIDELEKIKDNINEKYFKFDVVLDNSIQIERL